MADDEDDIDIDIDIDGDEPEEHVPIKTTDLERVEIRQQPDPNSESRRDSTHEKVGGAGADMDMKESFSIEGVDTDAPLMDDFQIPDWVTQDYHEHAGFNSADMDEKSRRMIESMLAEEEFYSGRSRSRQHQGGSQGMNALSGNSSAQPWTDLNHKTEDKSKNHESKKRKNSHERSGQSKRTASEDYTMGMLRLELEFDHLFLLTDSRLNAKLSSADLPSHNTRWTSEEDARLRQGIDIHGYGNWKAIAAIVGTRNPLQVKNHARHLAMSEKIPHDTSTNISDGEGFERRSSAANSAEEDTGERRRRPRSKNVKRIDASVVGESEGYAPYGRRGRRARSLTSESGNEEFTGSEFGATSGYDTDNDEGRSASKSPSLSAKGGSRSGSRAASSMDEDEDIDIDIESTDEESSSRLNLARSLPPFSHKSKSRSISPFSNSSTRSKLSSEFDSDSDHGLDNEDGDEIVESGSARKRSLASSPALSDTMGSSSELYATPNFNTSTSSVNSTGAGSSFKPLLKDVQYLQQQHSSQHQKGGQRSYISVDKITNSPKEKRTVSFGAVHVAELKPDLHSYDEDDVNSSEDGGFETTAPSAMDIAGASPLSSLSYQQNGHYSKGEQSNPESDREYEDEGLLGTGVRRHVNVTGASSISRKTQRDIAIKQKTLPNTSGSSGHSVSSQHHTKLIPSPTQTFTAPNMTTPSASSSAPRRIFDKAIITEEEKQVHSEFFCNKASKTPERYQRIRNTILQAWEKSPSTYLTKTSVRSGLKDCGDVNAIGRIHSWLESIGAINVGMTASSPGASLARPRNGGNNSSKRRGHSEERGWSSSSSSSAPRRVHHDIPAEIDDLDSVWVTPPIRRRRVRNEKGEWVDEKELEGRVIEHNVHINKNGNPERRSSGSNHSTDDLFSLDDEAFLQRYRMTKDEMEEELEKERLAAQNAKYFAESELLPVNTRVPKNRRAQHLLRQTRGFHEYEGDEESLTGYDPFRLVPLRKYNAKDPPPFRVKVSSDAMLIMDFHSHMAETEVIGLLGGLYEEDERILFILGVFPCRSISTGLQCEMDPASEIEAREFFSAKGFVVVGWYHSHPTFEPNPSIRDIETQCEYQNLFRRHRSGVEPFIGVIVSPFDPKSLSFLSKFQFLTASEQYDSKLNCREPYRFDREITRTNELSASVFQQLSDLAQYYRAYEHRVNLARPFRKGESITRLDKLLQSLNHHIFVDEAAGRTFLGRVREMIVQGFHLTVDRDPLMAMSSNGQSGKSSSSTTSLATTVPPPPSPLRQPSVPPLPLALAPIQDIVPSSTTDAVPLSLPIVEVSKEEPSTAILAENDAAEAMNDVDMSDTPASTSAPHEKS
ncbi:hypothetical protein BGZ58_007255 [Dissophora ornata]|nr:hypothetical protein BGZ58_007255 [Dissophora ornata]